MANTFAPARTDRETPRAGGERRRRFVVLECPYCHAEHDVLLGGGRQTAPCGRLMEASVADPSSGAAEAWVWGSAPEGSAPQPARLSS